MLNSNNAALTSACDSVLELRLARAGEAKVGRLETRELRQQVIRRKNVIDINVKVVVKKCVHFNLLFTRKTKQSDQTKRSYCDVINLCFGTNIS